MIINFLFIIQDAMPQKWLKCTIHEKIIINVFVVLVFIVVGLYKYNNLNALAIFGDEFGYWGNAAIVAGYDWNSLMSDTSYYGIGYSLILIPLMYIKSYALRYKVAIFLNILLSVGMFFCAIYIDEHIFGKKNYFQTVCESLISIATVSTIVQYRVAWSETLVTFLAWLSMVMLISIIEKFKIWKIIITPIILIYMIAVHQRTLPMVAIYTVVLVIYFIQKKDARSIFLFLLSTIVLYGMYKYVKNYQVLRIYSGSMASETNNYSFSMAWFIDYINIKFGSLKDFAMSVLGKVTIAIISSGLLLLTMLVNSFRVAVGKDEELLKYRIFFIFLMLSFMVMLLLSAVQCQGTYRQDLAVYSRYFDFVMGPIILVGINSLYSQKRINYVCILFSAVFCLIFAKPIYNYILSAEDGFNYICAPLFGAIMLWEERHIGFCGIVFILDRCVILSTASLLLFIKNNRKALGVIICFTFLIANVYLSNYVSDRINGWRNYNAGDALVISREIKEDDIAIYYIYDGENTTYLNILRELQYLRADRGLKKIDLDEINDISEENYYLITDSNYEIEDTDINFITGTSKIKVYYK